MSVPTKSSWKPKPDYVGYVSKDQKGRSTVTVEQDLILKKGDKITLEKMADKYAGMLSSGKISEEKVEELKSNTPDWKTHEARFYTPKSK